MKIVFIGTVQFSKRALEKLILLGADIAGVVTQKSAGINTDYADLRPVCDLNSIEYIETSNINSGAVKNFLKSKKPDYIFCFGWSQLLDGSLLRIPKKGIIGYHPSLLPRHRGRHPIIWALALGINETGSTFFFMDKDADNGDVLSQKKIPVAYSDDAQSLYSKVIYAALEQIEDFLPKLENGTYERIKQKDEDATFLRRRNRADGEIDWARPSFEIYNLIRALSHPYAGAHFMCKGKEIKVWRAKEVKNGTHKSAGYGRVIKLSADGSFVVKAGQDAICLIEYEPRDIGLEEGELIR